MTTILLLLAVDLYLNSYFSLITEEVGVETLKQIVLCGNSYIWQSIWMQELFRLQLLPVQWIWLQKQKPVERNK